jgi:hypothetical protein
MEVAGVHEFLGNAINLKGQIERKTDLRGESLPGADGEEEIKEVKQDEGGKTDV